MKSVLRTLCGVCAWLLWASPVVAATIALTPDVVTVTPGETIDVAAIISGLGNGVPPSVGAFDLDVSFNPSLLTPTDVTFGPFLGNESLLEAITGFSFATPGIVEFAEVSLLPTTDLDALQPDSFQLATLSFVGVGHGTTALLFSRIRVDDAFGDKIPTSAAVPEPASFALVGIGLLFAGWIARMRLAR